MASGGLILDYILKGVGAPSAYSFPGGSTGVPSLGSNSTEVGLYLSTTNNHLYAWDGSAWQDITGSGGGGVTVSSAFLAADVVLTTSFVDVLTLSVVAGSYHVTATIFSTNDSTILSHVVRLWDGTTVASQAAPAVSWNGNSTLCAPMTFSGSGTIRISAKVNTAGHGATINAHTTFDTTNVATGIIAIKYA